MKKNLKQELMDTRSIFMQKWHKASEYNPKLKETLSSINEALDALTVYASTTAKAVDQNVGTECFLECVRKYLDTLNDAMVAITVVEANLLDNSKD